MLHLSSRVVGVLLTLSAVDVAAQTIGTSGVADPPQVLWTDPGPIASRDLLTAEIPREPVRLCPRDVRSRTGNATNKPAAHLSWSTPNLQLPTPK